MTSSGERTQLPRPLDIQLGLNPTFPPGAACLWEAGWDDLLQKEEFADLLPLIGAKPEELSVANERGLQDMTGAFVNLWLEVAPCLFRLFRHSTALSQTDVRAESLVVCFGD